MYFQANARLPDADAEIVDVTPELIENATVISEQLAMATNREEATVPLLPLDLNTTNNVVAQVSDDLMIDITLLQFMMDIFVMIFHTTYRRILLVKAHNVIHAFG